MCEMCVAGIKARLMSVCVYVYFNMLPLMCMKMFISNMPANQRLAKFKNFNESC